MTSPPLGRAYAKVNGKVQNNSEYTRQSVYFARRIATVNSHVRERSDAALRQIAIARQDDDLIRLTSRDIVAAEAHYHRTCYREYSRDPNRLHHLEPEGEVDEDDENVKYSNIEDVAYVDLFEYIREEVMDTSDVIALNSLTKKLVLTMQSKGAADIKQSTKSHIRRKIEQEFGDNIHIFPDMRGKLLVIPDNMFVFELAKRYHASKMELEMWRSKSSLDDSTIDKAATLIRAAIKNMEHPNKWPFHPSDTTKESIVVPLDLKRFYTTLLTCQPSKKVTTQKVDMLTESFSQDLIYAVTGGQHKPPKHILLSYGVKALTGNVELIQKLNRLGHGISYSQLEENDTALCLQKLAAAANQSVILPESIQPHLFTTLAFDNIDRLEETLTGAGTTHRVNGIAVQLRVFGPHPRKEPLPPVAKLKQRSIQVDDKPLPIYISGERVGPKPVRIPDIETDERDQQTKTAQNKNLIWIITRQVDAANQTIPSWTGFNISTRDMMPISQDVVAYLPTINAPATDLSTVYEILNQSELMRQQLMLDDIVVVMDQALYAKATEILWKQSDRYAHIVIRLGTFHTIMTLLAIIGKRFQDAGLRDLCIESGLIVHGSISGVLDGKMYNRAVRVHKSIYEGLIRIIWKGFIPWMEANHTNHMEQLRGLMTQAQELHDDLCQDILECLLSHEDLSQTSVLWNEYLTYRRHNNGDMSAFCMTYLDTVEEILLGLIRAAREGNGELHLSAIRKMIPWCFAYDRINYARYLPAYFSQMSNLQETHPAVYQHFCSGGFSVQLSSDNPFGRIPVDQTTEVTVNKDTQTAGGTTKFSQKSQAVSRFYLTEEHRSGFLGNLRDMTNAKKSSLHHTELQKPRMEKDERQVAAITEVLENWINPFENSQDLVCISTATAATTEIRTDLMEANTKGEQAYARFKAERLEADPPQVKFHDPMKKSKLRTFSSLNRKKEARSNGKTIMLKTDRSLFGRMIVIAQSRSLDMKDVFSHPLGPLPWSLATPDGTPRKTTKAVLAKHLQKSSSLADGLPDNSATVIDGMSLVQKVRNDLPTFGDIAAAIHGMIRNEGAESSRIDVVFDTYTATSIKTVERTHRGEQQGLHLQNITASQIVRQWRRFLMQVSNKSSLIGFLVHEWRKDKYTNMLQGKVLFVTHLETCWRITGSSCEEVEALSSKHEEADGRLLLHAAHAATEGYTSVVICSEDTDVFILALAFSAEIAVPLFQKCGTQTRTRLLDIRKLSSSIGAEVCKALIGMHTFTGCDTVSAFAGKGKIRALELVKKNKDLRDTFLELGESWTVTPELHIKLERVACLLYATKPATSNIDEFRYHLFCSRKGELESHQLPPCRDCLVKHSLRANYQAAIWRRSLRADPETPSPHGNGWTLHTVDGNHQLEIDWMDGSPAPEAVLELLSCKCSRSCKLPSCVCLLNGLKCTDVCRLRDCSNQPSDDSESEMVVEDDDLSEDEQPDD